MNEYGGPQRVAVTVERVHGLAFAGVIQMKKFVLSLMFIFLSFRGVYAENDPRGAAAEKAREKAMTTLSQHQVEALEAYERLQKSNPELFTGRVVRPLVLSHDALSAYASEHKIVLGVAAETPYVFFIVDLVESRRSDGKTLQHPYLRVVSRGQLRGGINVVVIATIENPDLGAQGSVVMVTQERHALGATEIGMPRGFGEPGLSGETNALKELREETGYIGERATLLGSLNTDSGLTDSVVSYYYVSVLSRKTAKPETEEAIKAVSLLSRQDIWKAVRAGEIKDSFTLAALSLYEAAQREQASDTGKH